MKLVLFPIWLFVVIISGWYFFWPLIECSYALSWEPLLSDNLKICLFFLGAFVFWPVVLKSKSIII